MAASGNVDNPATRENQGLKAILLALMALVFIGAVVLIVEVLRTPAGQISGPGQPTSPTTGPTASPAAGGAGAAATAPSIAPGTQVAGAAPAPTSAASQATPVPAGTPTGGSSVASLPGSLSNPPAPGSFGVFDTNQSGSLPVYAKYLIATVILIASGILEMFLIILYAAFFVNDPMNSQLALGLPSATVRVFLVGIIVLVILIFAVLPDLWGSNKAVVLLFGLLSTVVGFYFGSRAVSDATSGAGTPTVRLTLDTDRKTQSQAAPTHITGTLDSSFSTVLGSPAPPIFAQLLDNSGAPVGDGPHIAIVDRAGKVEFDFDAVLHAAPIGTYILRVIVPTTIMCDERITLRA